MSASVNVISIRPRAVFGVITSGDARYSGAKKKPRLGRGSRRGGVEGRFRNDRSQGARSRSDNGLRRRLFPGSVAQNVPIAKEKPRRVKAGQEFQRFQSA